MEEGRNEESPDITPPLECGVSTCWVEVVLDGLVNLGKGVDASDCPGSIRVLLVEFLD